MITIGRQIFKPIRWPWLIALVLFGSPLCALIARRFPNVIFEDDAYFYLQICWNLGAGLGSTFDGLHPTNGYHLLWVLALTPLAAITSALGLGKQAFVAGASGLALLLAGTIVLAFFRGFWARVFAFLLILFCGLIMETTLLALIILAAIRSGFGPSCRPHWIFLLGAGSALTRIDFSWTIPLVMLLVQVPGRRARVFVLACLGALAGVSAHLMFQRALFGEWSTVSSAYKVDVALGQGGPAMLLRNFSSSGNLLRYATAGSLAVLVLSTRPDRRESALLGMALLPLAVYSLFAEMRDWYFLPTLLMLFWLAVRTVRLQPMGRIAALGSLMYVLAMGAYSVQYRTDMSRSMAFIEEADKCLRSDDVVFQVDGSGFTGYWLAAHVVDGDGLVNSWDYRRKLLSENLGGYLRDVGATYVLTNTAQVGEPLLSWHGISIKTHDADLRVDTGASHHSFAHFRLFALRDAS